MTSGSESTHLWIDEQVPCNLTSFMGETNPSSHVLVLFHLYDWQPTTVPGSRKEGRRAEGKAEEKTEGRKVGER